MGGQKREEWTAMNILVVDDEQEIADLLELYLTNDGFTVYKCYRGQEALDCLPRASMDLALLDVMLPDIDGFSLCRRIREQYRFPVIMLTAKTEEIDKITGLSIGADDYITKPFSPLEVIARVKAQLRRATRYNHTPGEDGAEDPDVLDFSGLVINRRDHTCLLYNRPISLTPMEFSLLWLLCENRGRVLSSEELFERVWGEKYLNSNNTVMVHIRRIREKMQEPPKNPKFIKTVWGVGYKIEK